MSGNYIVADTYNNVIQVFNPLGVFITQFTGYNQPHAVTIDLSGNYVIANTGNNSIVVISPLTSQIPGSIVKQFGSGGSTPGDGILNNPTGVAVDLSGNYLVADSGNNLIQIFTPSGQYYSELGSASLTSTNGTIPGVFNSPQGITVDKNTGKYVVVDTLNYRVMAFNV